MLKLPNICIVSPLQALSLEAERLSDRYTGIANITILNATLDDVDSVIPVLRVNNPDLVISRGGMAWMLKQKIPQPVIEIKTSAYDIIDALRPYLGLNKNIGVIGFRSVIDGCMKIARMLNLQLTEFIIDEMVNPCIENARNDFVNYTQNNQIDLIIGDAICPIYFGTHSVEHFIPFHSGVESIELALYEAIQLYQALANEHIEQNQLNLLLDHTNKFILLIDNCGKVIHCNHKATGLLQLSKHDLINKKIPSLTLNWEDLQNNIPLENELINTPCGEFVVNQFPIVENENLNRVVITLQTSSNLQNTEQKIRINEAKKLGFHARYHFDDFITCNREMQDRLRLARIYAGTEATILLLGENGTGKEVLAQSIHNASSHSNGPFVAVNCGAIPASIMESELFGYVDGAFSGASKKGRAGMFELAHNGTIFLDEISELDKFLQAKLLRILQERQLMRLGADHMIPVNVRVIAATNRNLPAMIATGEFREDLFYRLNVLKVTTLPLRERPDDIQIIGQATFNTLRKSYQLPPIALSEDLWGELKKYLWPGNVRQLNNIMERLALSFQSGVVSLSAAALLIEDLQADKACSSKQAQHNCPDCQLLEGPYKRIRSRILKGVLLRQQNNKSRAAKPLDIDRSSFSRWLGE
ncbi:AAA domain-containing protein [Salmonella enterica]|nr:AAA domain-containing protein [Salmonella enterica]